MGNQCRRSSLQDQLYQTVGCAMEVLNTLGHGLLEKPYENAMVVELELRNIPYQQQSRYKIWYKDVAVGLYIPDLIVFDQIIVDIKCVPKLGNRELGQMLNYLKITELQTGLLLNFKKPRIEWRRVISPLHR